MEKCWLCTKVFTNKSDLNAHLVSSYHRRQSVICPWCGEGKTFTRVSDLSVHCSNRHFIETNSLPRSFLTARNCFYFAIYPQDYAQIHQPEKWASPNATEARRLVMKMLDSQKESQIKRDNWRSGWRVASKLEDKENLKKMSHTKTKTKAEVLVNSTDKLKIENGKKEAKEETTIQKFNPEERKVNLKEANDAKHTEEQNIPLDLSKKIESSEKSKVKRKAKELLEEEKVKVRKVSVEINERMKSEVTDVSKCKSNEAENDSKFGKICKNEEMSNSRYGSGNEKSDEEKECSVVYDQNKCEGSGFNEAVSYGKNNGESSDEDMYDKKQCDVGGFNEVVSNGNENCELIGEDVNDEKKCDGGDFNEVVSNGSENCELISEDVSDEKKCDDDGFIEVVVNGKKRGENMKAEKKSDDGDFNEVVSNGNENCKLSGEDMNDKKKCAGGGFVEVVVNEKKSGEGMDDERLEDNAKDKIRNINEKRGKGKECVKSDNEKDIVKDRSEECLKSKEEKYVEKPGGVCLSDVRLKDTVKRDEETYIATKLILEEMYKEDKESVSSDLKESKSNVGKLPREMIWKRSDDGILRRIFKKESEEEERSRNRFEKAETTKIEDVKGKDIDLNNNELGYAKKGYAQKAIDLLKTGAMPLVPPGRREWKGNGSFHIHLYGCDFTWPPPEWQQMSSDRKLMAWEHTAFQLEYLQHGILSPTMSRSFLLDKYNFLALPGSGKVKKEQNEKGAARARFYLYQMLREVANGKDPSQAEMSQIDTLELIKNTGELQKQLASLEVPLRLVNSEKEAC